MGSGRWGGASGWDGFLPFSFIFPFFFFFTLLDCWTRYHSWWLDFEHRLLFRFSLFSLGSITGMNLSQQISLLQPLWSERVETRIQACVYFFLNQHHNLAKYHSTVFERKFGALFPMPSKLLDLALKWKGRYQKQVTHPAFQTCQRRFLGGVTPHLHCVLFILWTRRDHQLPMGSKPALSITQGRRRHQLLWRAGSGPDHAHALAGVRNITHIRTILTSHGVGADQWRMLYLLSC